jgi:serine/threonine protein kinase
MNSFACSFCGLELTGVEAAAAPQACPRCGQPLLALPATVIVAEPAPPWPTVLDSDEGMPEPESREGRIPKAASDPATAVLGYEFLDAPQTADELGRLGPYRVLRAIGSGGMGVVFEAEDSVLRRRVAIKAMLPARAESSLNRQRFLREALATAAIEHEHIVTIYQISEQRNIPYLVMQFLQGESLETRLLREGRLPLADTLRIARETAEALVAAHASNLVHRDVKPANIWLEERSGRVKLLDFGLARLTAEDTQITRDGVILGTPAYMSPEQARGKVVDPPGDLFSLGCILYQMCTGRLPFEGSDVMSRLVSLVMDEPAPPAEIASDVPPTLADLMLQLLAKHPAERPASARVVVDAIRALEEELASAAEAPHAARPNRIGSDTSLDDFASLGIVNLQEDPIATEQDTSAAPPLDLGQPVANLEELAGHALGRFELGPVLGHGYHGVTFQAHDLKYEQPVALKVFFPEFPQKSEELERFIRITKVLLTLRHPHLTAVTAVGRTGPYCWLAAELVEGENLMQVLQREQPDERSGWLLALCLGIHLARGLEFAWQNKLRHGFLTPTNILVPYGEMNFKIADFMLHHALKGSSLRRRVRRTKQIAEAVYTAPELLDGREVRDEVCDLYSAAAVVYHALTGRPPFEGESPRELVQLILSAEPPRPRTLRKGIPGRFEEVVLQMLHKDRGQRLQTPTELLKQLEQIAREQGVEV